MKRKVCIVYNPYSRKASLTLDGQAAAPEDGRFEDRIVGRPMADWLESQSVSYRRWRGLLPELMERLNDDALEIAFCGAQADFFRVRDALEAQRAAALEAGYADDGWTIGFADDGYGVELMRARLRNLRDNMVVNAPTQELLLELRALDGRLDGETELDFAQMRELMEAYLRVMRACMEKCPENQQNSWGNALRQIENCLK